MKTAAIFLCTFLCATAGLWATTVRPPSIGVYGDVPQPGRIEEGGMTIQAAVAMAGLDLRPFYVTRDSKDAPCPIRVTFHRVGEKDTIYDPQKDGKKLQSINLQPSDVIDVEDFRKHPDKIRERTKRIEEMLSFGSTEIGDEIVALAELRREYALWMSRNLGKQDEPMEAYLRKECVRLTEEGKGEKTAKLLELHRSASILEGLAPGHPLVQATDQLIKMFVDAGQTTKEGNKPLSSGQSQGVDVSKVTEGWAELKENSTWNGYGRCTILVARGTKVINDGSKIIGVVNGLSWGEFLKSVEVDADFLKEHKFRK